MNILILGDSLTFPRRTQTIQDMWPSVLQTLLISNKTIQPMIWFRARRGSDIFGVLQEIRDLSEYVSEKEFDYSIVQVGVVDCSPRPYPKLIAKLLNSNNLGLRIKVFIYNYLKFFYFFYSKPDVSQKMWRKQIEEVAFSLNKIAKQIIFLCIAPPGEVLCQKIPKIESHIKTYNEILVSIINNINYERNMTVIDPYQSDFDKNRDLMQNCGHHLTNTGHQKVSKKIFEFISSTTLLNCGSS